MSEENKPNWVDKANLASNLFQNVQLSGVQSSLRTLAELDAERTRLVLNEQATSEREDRLRENIWMLENAFAPLMSDPATTPSAKYVMAKELQDSLPQLGVSTDRFRQFVDKDRVARFVNQVQQSMKEYGSRMSVQELGNADQYLRYQSEAKPLVDLVQKLQKLQSERNEKERELAVAIEQLKPRRQRLDILQKKIATPEGAQAQVKDQIQQVLFTIALIIVALPTFAALLSLFWLLGVPIYDGFNGENRGGDTVLVKYGIVALIVGVVGLLCCWKLLLRVRNIKILSEEIASLGAEIAPIERKTAELHKWLETPLEPAVFGGFPAKSLPDLVQLKQERDAFLAEFRMTNKLFGDEMASVDQAPHSVEVAGSVVSAQVQELARNAHTKISAIKLLRDQNPGLGLAEAKDIVESSGGGGS